MAQTDLMNFFLRNYIDTIFGGKSQQTSDIFNNLTANGTENVLGGGLQNSDMLSGILQSIITGRANPISQSMQSKVNRNFDRNIRGVNENLAATGMSRSGVGSAIQAQAAGEAAGQVADAEAQLYSQAIQQLLGIDQLNLSERAQDINFIQSLMQGKANKDQQNLQEEANDFNFFRDFFPGLIQGSAQVGSAAILASDSRFKENINKIGKSKSGIPVVEFNYKGDNRRFIGVIAQDVEKIKPEAVVEDEDGMKYVNYDLIDVDFHEV